MIRRVIVLLIAACVAAVVPRTAAQTDLSIVYVTVQRNASLRAGPGTHWERLAVLPYGTTYRATGRTLEADWVQIAYEGALDSAAYPEATIDGITYGWVSSTLLFWTGSVMELPVDGVPTVNFVRAASFIITLQPDMPIFTGITAPGVRVPYPLPGPARVEASGRLGDPPYYWIQFKVGDEFYWVSSTSVGAYYGLAALPDARQLVASGRLNRLLARGLGRLDSVLNEVQGRWTRLALGQPVSCNNLPGDFTLALLTDNDLDREPLYRALVAALTEAEIATERALGRLRTACLTPTVPISADIITAALDELAAARRAQELAHLLLRPLQAADQVP